jgi:hypothetical protein
LPTQPVNDGTVSLGLDPPHQLPNPPIRPGQSLRRFSLRDVPTPHLMQYLQHLPISLRQQSSFLFIQLSSRLSRGTSHFALRGISHFAATPQPSFSQVAFLLITEYHQTKFLEALI